MRKIALFFVSVLFMVSLLACSDDEANCPDGMVDCELQNGDSVCVPDHIGC